MVIASITFSGVVGSSYQQAISDLCNELLTRARTERFREDAEGNALPPTMSEAEFQRWNAAVANLEEYLHKQGNLLRDGLSVTLRVEHSGTNDGGGLNLTTCFLS